MTPCFRALLACCVVLASAAVASAGWDVWTVSQTRRLTRDEPPGADRAARLAMARNERESFQILLRADQPLDGVTLEAGAFRAADGKQLPAVVTLYRQHQFFLKQGTSRNDTFQPGWYPDALIPFNHPTTGEPLREARFTAVPFALPAAETHGFWVDVYVPASAAAGVYQAIFRVAATGQTAIEIPVELTVWDFALRDTPTLQTALGSPADRMRGHYRKRAADGKDKEPADWNAVELQVAELLRDHRINATPPRELLTPVAREDGTYEIPAERVEALRAFIDRYHLNAIQTPHPSSAVRDPVAEKAKLHAWLAAWDRAAEKLDRPGVTFFTYLLDEPNDAEAYRYVQTWGPAIREARSALKVMVVEQTWTQDEAWGDLYGAVDIWCPLFSLFRPESAAARQALGETVWTYTALCQGKKTPWWHTDFPLLHYRVPAWIAWRYRIRGLLYWGGMSFWNQVEDPWTQPETLDRRDQSPLALYNGEGSLLYPGRDVGYEGIAPSLRLKALRDAIEDYELLAILERQGRATEAEKIVLPLASSWYEWNPDPAAYQQARRALAELILATPSNP